MKLPIVTASLFTPISRGRWGLPLILWGEPGVAKTAILRMLCEMYGLPFHYLSPGLHGEGAFGVVPVPENGVLTYPRPDWTMMFDDGKRGVVVVDELTTAPPAYQPPLLGLTAERMVGNHVLHAGVRVIGAANPPEQAAAGYDLAPPLANRFIHLEWDAPTPEEHVAYMLSGDTGNGGKAAMIEEAAAVEKRVLDAWPEAFATARGLETAFIMARPDLKNKMPKVGDPKAGRAWPSDRTWEMAARAYASALVHGLTETDKEDFVSGAIGAAVASEWFTFIENADLPDAAELLDGKVKFTHDSKRLDKTMAVLNAATALVTPTTAKKRADRAAKLWEIITELGTGGVKDLDILVPPVHALIKVNLHSMKDAAKILAKLQPVLKAAGIRPEGR